MAAALSPTQHNRRRRENSKTKTSAKVVLFLGNEDEEVIFKKHAFRVIVICHIYFMLDPCCTIFFLLGEET